MHFLKQLRSQVGGAVKLSHKKQNKNNKQQTPATAVSRARGQGAGYHKYLEEMAVNTANEERDRSRSPRGEAPDEDRVSLQKPKNGDSLTLYCFALCLFFSKLD